MRERERENVERSAKDDLCHLLAGTTRIAPSREDSFHWRTRVLPNSLWLLFLLDFFLQTEEKSSPPPDSSRVPEPLFFKCINILQKKTEEEKEIFFSLFVMGSSSS